MLPKYGTEFSHLQIKNFIFDLIETVFCLLTQEKRGKAEMARQGVFQAHKKSPSMQKHNEGLFYYSFNNWQAK